jgi:preprotein translocase subunit SecD
LRFIIGFLVVVAALFCCLHLQVADVTVAIGQKDLEEMQVFQTGKGLASVLLKLKPTTATRLFNLTQKNIGQPVLWVWNGRVLSIQTLQSPLGEDLTVYNFTSFEAEDFSKIAGFSAISKRS